MDRLIAECQVEGGPRIEFCDDQTVGELGADLQSALLRTMRELVRNACRHSGSKNVLLGLAQDDGRVCVQVQDWGIGFDLQRIHGGKRGLKLIRKLVAWMGGSVGIESQPGMGTCVTVEIPLLQGTAWDNRVRDPRPR